MFLLFFLFFSCLVRAEDFLIDKSNDLTCLTANLYFEANFEPIESKIAVAQIVMQRVKSNYYPDSVCGVITQGIEKNICQFSWLCDKNNNSIKINTKEDMKYWKQNLAIAKVMLSSKPFYIKELGSALLYHDDTVTPWWSTNENVTFLLKLGHLSFYSEVRNSK